ncbi:hypothetical protein ACNKHU_12305 [Shigella flexneri]
MLASPIGRTCHKGTSSCFGDTAHQWLFLYQLERLLARTKICRPGNLLYRQTVSSGTQRIAQKWREGVETALAATST